MIKHQNIGSTNRHFQFAINPDFMGVCCIANVVKSSTSTPTSTTGSEFSTHLHTLVCWLPTIDSPDEYYDV